MTVALVTDHCSQLSLPKAASPCLQWASEGRLIEGLALGKGKLTLFVSIGKMVRLVVFFFNSDPLIA